jgi:Uma2 family endonuclease
VAYLYRLLFDFATQSGGKVLFAPLRLRLGPGKIREPDLIFLASASDARRQDEFWTGADLVMEVVSPGHPQRDLVTKRIEYAQAGILEYWLVDPRVNSIVALPLEGGAYREHGRFQHGETTQSAIFPDLSIHVTGVMDAA